MLGAESRLQGALAAAGSRRAVVVTLAALTLLGLFLRLLRYDQALIGDELSTLYHVWGNGLRGTIDAVSTNAEITPPLYFALAWLVTQLGSAPELVRLPALIAGVACIPLVFLVGARTVGRRAGLLAAALMAVAPVMAYYSADGRAYSVMLALLLGSTLALLAAAEGGRRRWWVAYAVLSALAMYSHYTAAFVLAAQLLWLLWAHPRARRPALLANLGAVVLYLPWLPGLIADLGSPTRSALERLQGSGFGVKRAALEQWAFGDVVVGIGAVPGRPAVILGSLGVAVAVAATLLRWWRGRSRTPKASAWGSGFVLVLVLALAAPVGEGLLLVVGGPDLLGARNMTASWPGFALSVGALLVAAGPLVGIAAAIAVFGSFAIGTVRSFDSSNRIPDFAGAAAAIEASGEPGEPVVDMTALKLLTPTPLTPLSAQLPEASHPQFKPFLRPGEPPFLLGTEEPPGGAALRAAFREAAGGKLAVLAFAESRELVVRAGDRLLGLRAGPGEDRLTPAPPGTTIVSERLFSGFAPLLLLEARVPARTDGRDR